MIDIRLTKKEQSLLRNAFFTENRKAIDEFEAKKNIQFKNGKYYCSKTNKSIHIIQE